MITTPYWLARGAFRCKSVIVVCLLNLVAAVQAQPTFEWVRVVPGETPLSHAGSSIAVDLAGNAYVTGDFATPVQFGNIVLTNRASSYDLLVAKYDAAGAFQWVRHVTGDGDERSGAVAVTPHGRCYFSGRTLGRPANLGNGIIVLEGVEFLAMLDVNGNTLWALPIGQDYPPVTALGVDSVENCYVAYHSLRGVGPAQNTDIALMKVSPAGTVLWQTIMGGDRLDRVGAIATDQAGNVLVAGSFQSPAIFSGRSVDTGTNRSRMFIAKYSAAGALQWIRYDFPDQAIPATVSTDGGGNAYLFWFDGWASFDALGNLRFPIHQDSGIAAGIATPSGEFFIVGDGLTPEGALRSSIRKYTTEAGLAWQIAGASQTTLHAKGIAYDTNGHLYVGGYGRDTHATFDTMFGPTNVSFPYPSSFLTKLTRDLTAAITVITQGLGSVLRSPDRAFYSSGDQVILTAMPGRWFTFSHWGDGPTDNPRQITIGANNNYTAIFSPTTAVETLSFSNLSRTAPVGMPSIFIDGQFVTTGAVTRFDSAELSMSTTFPHGSIFYTLDGGAPDFGARLYRDPIILRRSAIVRAIAYDASFLAAWESDPVNVDVIPTFTVSTASNGGGTVIASPAAPSYVSNSLVTLTATASPGWAFLAWLGDASDTNPVTNIRVTDRDLCVRALFGTALKTSILGNGTVTIDPTAALYPYGTMVRLTAVPQSGSYFGAWGDGASSPENPVTLLITNAKPAVAAAFGQLNAEQVSLTIQVNGHGRVTMAPGGNRFPINQSMMLTASADANQEFLGWSGDASGGSANLAVVLTQSKVITATFTTHPRIMLGPCLGGWHGDGFQLTVSGEIGRRYMIEGSSDLVNWSRLANLTNDYGILQMLDATSNKSTRFYRAFGDQ